MLAQTLSIEEEEVVRFRIAYLTADKEAIRGGLKSVAQIGVAALLVFEFVYRERFDLTGVAWQLDRVKKAL